MCGFVTYFPKKHPCLVSDMIRMSQMMSHRGPDSDGVIVKNGRGFAHRRLKILDLTDRATQPMQSPCGRYLLCFNGEIYNYIELKEQLELESSVEHGDTEVLLHHLISYGSEGISKLNGMFAFVFWDSVTDDVIVARDRFGEKPLFFFFQPEIGTIISSEIKPIISHPKVNCAVSTFGVDEYIKGAYSEDSYQTMFEGVHRFPSASFACFKSGAEIVNFKKYWSITSCNVNHELTLKTALEKFDSLINNSVHKRLRSDVNVGCSLSGGIDSSSIVANIRRVCYASNEKRELKVFTAVFPDDPTVSEEAHAAEVADYYDAKQVIVEPKPENLVRDIEDLHWFQEEPFLSASIYLQYCVCKEAKKHGVKVLIDGQGADELLGGYQTYFADYQKDLIQEGRFLKAIIETSLFRFRLWRESWKYQDSQRRFNSKVGLGFKDIIKLFDFRTRVVGPMNYRNTMNIALVSKGLPQLLRYADRNSMANSVEVRLPFLDYGLVDFLLTVPSHILVNNGWQKFLLRKTSEMYLPSSIAWRVDKVGFAAPLDEWLRSELKDWAYKELFHGEASRLPQFDQKEVKSLWDSHQNGINNYSWLIWKWISLSIWLKMVNKGSLCCRLEGC